MPKSFFKFFNELMQDILVNMTSTLLLEQLEQLMQLANGLLHVLVVMPK